LLELIDDGNLSDEERKAKLTFYHKVKSLACMHPFSAGSC
jgi:hypothetical protein